MYISTIIIEMNVLHHLKVNAIYYCFKMLNQIDSGLTKIWEYFYSEPRDKIGKAIFINYGTEVGPSELTRLCQDIPAINYKYPQVQVLVQQPLRTAHTRFDYNMIRYDSTESLEILLRHYSLEELENMFAESHITMKSDAKLLGLQVHLHESGQDIIIDFGKYNYMICKNKLLDREFLKWYLEKHHGYKLSLEEHYRVSFINQNMDYVMFDDSDGGIILTKDGYDMVPLPHDFLEIDSNVDDVENDFIY